MRLDTNRLDYAGSYLQESVTSIDTHFVRVNGDNSEVFYPSFSKDREDDLYATFEKTTVLSELVQKLPHRAGNIDHYHLKTSAAPHLPEGHVLEVHIGKWENGNCRIKVWNQHPHGETGGMESRSYKLEVVDFPQTLQNFRDMAVRVMSWFHENILTPNTKQIPDHIIRPNYQVAN